MLRKAFLAAFAVAFAGAADAADCHDYVLISARGTTEPQGPSVGFVGMINTTLSTASNGIEYDTVYPATSNLTGAFDGVADIVRYINAGVASCPQQKYALLGYSQGASVVDISLHNFTDQTSPAYQAIKAIVVIGNPGHINGSSANVDENGGDTTRYFNGSFYLGGFGAIPDPYYADDKVLDICAQGDVVCALPPNGTFSIEPAHLIYGPSPKVQSMGAEFLLRKLASDTSASSSASASASATAAASRSKTRSAATASSTRVKACGPKSAKSSGTARATVPSTSSGTIRATATATATPYQGAAAASLPLGYGVVIGSLAQAIVALL